MKILWAPWRIEYILQPKAEGCIFCSKPSEDKDRENLIVYRGKRCFIILNYYPYNNGHLMVIPYRHVATLNDLSSDELVEMMQLVAHSTEIISRTMKAEGFNIGINMGKVAGAGIQEHVHIHVVPRWNGDTNFMPITGHTKVISQALEETWAVLADAFRAP